MLDDLTAQELAMLGHALRLVPGNACLTRSAASFGVDAPIAYFSEIPAYRDLWEKVAQAIRDRDDVAPYRVAVTDASE